MYMSDYRRALEEDGDLNFSVRYGHPVLVLRGMAGELSDSRPGRSSGTLFAVDRIREAMRVNSLIDRVFPLTSEGQPRVKDGPISLTMGRTTDTELTIPEVSISKAHCDFRLERDKVSVVDLGSTNGTVVNGDNLKAGIPRPLVDGDEVTIGRFVCVFYSALGFLKRIQSHREKLTGTGGG